MREFRRWLRRLRRRATFLATRQLMRAAGFTSARRIGRLLADIQYGLSWRVRRRCARDLALLLGRPAGDPSVRRQLRQAYRVNTIAVLEVLAMFDRRLDDDVLNAASEAEGLERLRAALDAGRGAILLGAHMGNGALLTARLARAGWPVSVVYRQARMMSAGFFERGHAVGALDQVIERAEHERGIEAAIGSGQVPSIPDLGGQPARGQGSPRLFHMPRRDVDQVDAVSVPQQPRRVHAGTAPHIEDAYGWWRQMPTQDLTGPDELQFREATHKAVLFPARLIVSDDSAEIVVHHARP